MTLKATEPHPREGGPLIRRNGSGGLHTYLEGEFSPREAMEKFGWSHDEWDVVKYEGLHSDIMREAGWGAYRATAGGRALLAESQPTLTRTY